MFSLFNTNKLSSTETVDIIEKIVYEYLKPLGFRKHGRTLHRFVDGDISQVINFQNGCPAKGMHDILWINLGIRVPECEEIILKPQGAPKKYYQEHECTFRNRLGNLVDGNDTFYNLKKSPYKIGKDIVERLKKYVIPVFNLLNSRDSILKHRKEIVSFDEVGRSILFNQAIIYAKTGNLSEAAALFNEHYQKELKKYNHDFEHGRKMYLEKGNRLIYRNTRTGQTETITATKKGYVTIYDASRHKLTRLEEQAKELGIEIL